MSAIDFVKWDGAPDIFAWKFPSQNLSTWTQLIVNESQEAFLVRNGCYSEPLKAGRHTLSTENLPWLSSFVSIPFGGKSPFTAEVWFVNKVANLDIKWGTLDPIQLKDPKFEIMLSVRAFGQYGVRIFDARTFLNRLAGTLSRFDAESLSNYLRGALITSMKTEIATAIVTNSVSVLEIAPHLETLSTITAKRIDTIVHSYGIKILQFNIHSISVPEDDTIKSLKQALAKRAEMNIVGFNYQQERSFDVMESAASNEGSGSGIIGSAMGLGVGVAMGGNAANSMNTIIAGNPMNLTQQNAAQQPITSAERIAELKELGTLLQQGILTKSEFEQEKARIFSL